MKNISWTKVHVHISKILRNVKRSLVGLILLTYYLIIIWTLYLIFEMT
jgi:hypothetical protein